jgi:DNA-binding MarR family transcriptional regulator
LDIGDHRELRVLEAIAENERTTQRGLASQLGIALGLTNLYLKRLVRKGYIKCINVRPNRVKYFITPKGLAGKARLTYEFMEYSLRLYRETRQHLRVVLGTIVRDGRRHVAIYGTGEPAELAYMSLKELGLEPVAVFGEPDQSFLGIEVRPISDHPAVAYDLLIVATLRDPTLLVTRLLDAGVPSAKLCTLRPSSARPLAKLTPRGRSDTPEVNT